MPCKPPSSWNAASFSVPTSIQYTIRSLASGLSLIPSHSEIRVKWALDENLVRDIVHGWQIQFLNY